MTESLRCSLCDAELDEEDTYCQYCGTSVFLSEFEAQKSLSRQQMMNGLARKSYSCQTCLSQSAGERQQPVVRRGHASL